MKTMKQNLYDCFLFNDEIELLEIRLKLLEHVVDYFVIVQSKKTFTNKNSQLFFPENADYIIGMKSKLIIITLDELEGKDAWARESFSRNSVSLGLSNAAINDLIMISDIDEIPNPDILEKIKLSRDQASEKTLVLDFFNFKFNYRLFSGLNNYWPGPVLDEYKNIKNIQQLRERRWSNFEKSSNSVVLNAGWHFSFLTSNGDISKKLDNFSHQESRIQNRHRNVNDLINRREGFHDHIYPGSVWGVISLDSLKCSRLIVLIKKFPEFICNIIPDDEQSINFKVRKSIINIVLNEKKKLLQYYNYKELINELLSRVLALIIRR